ncbi:MAG TPA: CpaF family protein [Alphaproteobacteria bacterium]
MFRRFSSEIGSGAAAPPTLADTKERAAVIPPPRSELARRTNDVTDLKVRFHQRLLDMLNLPVIDKVPIEELRREVGQIVREMLIEEGIALNAKECVQLIEEILDEVLGLGPLEPLLKDDTISDILVNTHKQVFVERFGRLELTPVRFKDDKHLLRIIDKIVSGIGRRIDESQPWVDARLSDGSRVNAIIPPSAIDGPLLSIRKFTRTPLTIDRLIEIGTMTKDMAEFLKRVVQSRLNLLISGGTGSGKTTMLNALSTMISDRERIITIEDAAELQLQQSHVLRLETRPPNIEGKGAVTQRDLVRNALRMRPDRIIVGEVRGAEVLDMLQAMNTGHDGSMTTVHANSPRDSLARLEQMIGMTGFNLSDRTMRRTMASALNVIVQLERMSDGKRRIVSIQEITGMEGDVVTMQEIFVFRRTGIDGNGNVLGHFEATGVRPKFAQRFEAWGVPLPADMFEPRRRLA